jgi:hypothetical protein
MGKNGRIDTDLRAGFDGGTLHTFGAERVRIVREHDSGREENVVFDRGELADIAIAVDTDAIAEHTVVVNGCAVPYDAIVADAIALANDYVVAGLETISNFNGGVDHASGADLRAIADTHGFALDRAAGWIAQNHASIDRTIRA